MKKYELTENKKEYMGHVLYRIKAIKSFSDVKKGDIGGWIEKESNLSQAGNSWVYDDAMVFGDAKISGNAWIFGNAEISGNAEIFGNADIFGDVEISGNAEIFGDAKIYGNAWIYGSAKIYGVTWIIEGDENYEKN